MDFTVTGQMYYNNITSQRFISQTQQMQNENTGIDGNMSQNDKLLDVCQEFESLFVKQMLNSMRKTINKSGLIDGGLAEEIFEDMLYDKYALEMAKTANFGIAEELYNQLSAYIE